MTLSLSKAALTNQWSVLDARIPGRHRGSMAGRTLDIDGAAALFDDSVDDREAEPRALARFFRGEEWFERSLARGAVHAHAGVPDMQRYESRWSLRFRF